MFSIRSIMSTKPRWGVHMQGYNLLLIIAQDGRHILMCRRKKEPYLGKNNLIGGKIEPGENGLHAAYREMYEEAALTGADVQLMPIMTFQYPVQNCYVEVYAGRCLHAVNARGDENDLYWSDLQHDFFSLEEYAGEGNIGHILEVVRIYAPGLLAQ